ncbi:MAG: hypothetical protein A2284_07130 [Deltaproteobacteria bacterium RIFOXYA12_FULL_61_11]|nr:MAG: hypothetical protein A2284_07130 [Deltaproteobacteria bacterium RIFOXYA12_FULL_61_11]
MKVSAEKNRMPVATRTKARPSVGAQCLETMRQQPRASRPSRARKTGNDCRTHPHDVHVHSWVDTGVLSPLAPTMLMFARGGGPPSAPPQ